jgi:hypothetical protein
MHRSCGICSRVATILRALAHCDEDSDVLPWIFGVLTPMGPRSMPTVPVK